MNQEKLSLFLSKYFIWILWVALAGLFSGCSAHILIPEVMKYPNAPAKVIAAQRMRPKLPVSQSRQATHVIGSENFKLGSYEVTVEPRKVELVYMLTSPDGAKHKGFVFAEDYKYRVSNHEWSIEGQCYVTSQKFENNSTSWYSPKAINCSCSADNVESGAFSLAEPTGIEVLYNPALTGNASIGIRTFEASTIMYNEDGRFQSLPLGVCIGPKFNPVVMVEGFYPGWYWTPKLSPEESLISACLAAGVLLGPIGMR